MKVQHNDVACDVARHVEAGGTQPGSGQGPSHPGSTSPATTRFAFLVLFAALSLTPAFAGEFSNENLRLTVIHMQKLAKELNVRLAEKQAELEKAQADYADAAKSNASGMEAILLGQAGMEKVRKENSQLIMDRVAAVHRADIAEANYKTLKETTDARIHRMKRWICSAVAALALMAVLWLGLPKLSPPYGVILAIAAPGAAYAALWMVL